MLKCQFADPITTGDLVYLNLGGRGVRDLVRVGDGFLVLAGPVNELIAPYHLYWWDGNDCVPGAEGGTGRVVFLGELPLREGAVVEDAKAEGLTVEAETASHYVVLALFDGLKKGAPQRYRVRRPG